jgi:prepilin-type N-terminal cleavage/methylation domain-containing protein
VARRLKDRASAQHGFTLIEVLMSALVVTLIAGAVLLTNVTQSGTTPVFQNFAYQLAPGTDAGGNQYEILPDERARYRVRAPLSTTRSPPAQRCRARRRQRPPR